MEILFFFSMVCLVAFVLLATYDGAYLHLWKYELFNRKESAFEHITHTIRALLFPMIVWTMFFRTDFYSFLLGIFLVIVDLIVLAIDAYSEKESRKFMGGLPRWEYILHLFANSFHFASIILLIATRIEIGELNLFYSSKFLQATQLPVLQMIAVNLLPGAIILGLFHLLLLFEPGKIFWNNTRKKITCC